MEMTLLFSNEFATISADNQLKLIQVNWLQHTSHTTMREVLLKASEFARKEGFTKWLFDLRKLNFTTPADNNWSANELFPSFNLQEKHYMACVATPQNVEMMTGTMVRTAIEEHPELANKIDLEVFVSIESALEWLKGQGEAGADTTT